MTFADWIAEPVNWVYALLALLLVYSSIRVVTSQNVIRAAFSGGASASMAGMSRLSADLRPVVGSGIHRAVIVRSSRSDDKRAPAAARSLDHQRRSCQRWSLGALGGSRGVRPGVSSTNQEVENPPRRWCWQ